MNEVTKIHLGRQAFTISVAAHKALRDYIDAITMQVGDKDVVDEVELRMAELLAERGIIGEKVVLVKDVDYLKKQLGDPKDFKESADDETEPANAIGESKRLFRDTDNAVLAGVAGGLAKYFGVDVLVIRILFVLATIAWGGGILVYIVLWLLVPEAKTSSEKLQMAGKPVTVDSLKEVVERADVKGAARRANNSIAGPINSFFGLVLKVIGVAFILAGIGALFGLIAGETYILLNNSQLAQYNIFPIGFREHLLLHIGVAVAALLALFVILFGVAIFRRKWPIRTWVTGILIGLLFLGVAASGALAADTVPHVRDRYNANLHTSVRELKTFTSIIYTGPNEGVNINYQFSDKYSASLKYYGNPDISKLKTTVSNGALNIDTQHFDWHRHCSAICLPPTYNVEITVSSPIQPQLDWPTNEIKVFPGSMYYYGP
jgi:phage shock protein PspC (stress-responsive transcriptional regulator)